MAAAIIYLVLALALLLRNGLFGLFNDGAISRRQFALLLFLKALAIPSFYILYERSYGGLEQSDTGKFYNDARVINNCAYKHPLTYLKLLAGFGDGEQPPAEHQNCLDKTKNWKKGSTEKFFYNDNRVLIRLHSVLHFAAFDSWFVHGFFSCLLSFVGLFYLYSSFRSYFQGKETGVMAILCLFPSLWFYTGTLQKEGLMLFVLGLATFLIKKILTGPFTRKDFFVLLFLVYLSFLLKPYLLLTAQFCFMLFFWLQQKSLRKQPVYFIAGVLLMTGVACGVLLYIKGQSPLQVALHQQRAFAGTAAGGIFLHNDSVYLRLDYDTSLVSKVAGEEEHFRIRKGASYMYWEDSHNDDTLYVLSNQDTGSVYGLAFMTPASRSNYTLPDITEQPMHAVLQVYYYSLFFPLFINAESPMQFLASFENFAIILALIITIGGLMTKNKDRLLPLCFIIFALIVCFVIGISTTNSGAVFRYRAPAVVFMLLAGWYYFQWRGYLKKSEGEQHSGMPSSTK